METLMGMILAMMILLPLETLLIGLILGTLFLIPWLILTIVLIVSIDRRKRGAK